MYSFTMILPVYNEESRIARVIDYYSQFADLIVVDNYSTDRTIEIVESKGISYFRYRNEGSSQTPEWNCYVANKVTTDYILFLSCSEFHSERLLEEYEHIAKEGKYDVVTTVRQSYISGVKSDLWGGRKFIIPRIVRFINKNGIDYDNIVIHGQYTPLQKSRQIDLPNKDPFVVTHLRDVDIENLFNKSLDYALLEAGQREGNSNGVRFWKLICLVLKECLRFFLLPLKQWNMVSLREIFVRMVMHIIVAWRGWELRSGNNLKDSEHKNEKVWRQLVLSSSKGD